MKATVVLSGGMDSATVLALMAAQHGSSKVQTVTFNYGSKHNARENHHAKLLSEFYSVPNKLVHLPFVNELFKSDLLSSGGDVPEGHYAEDSMKRTVVPFRNAIMLSIAAGIAASSGGGKLVIGNHAGDHAIYPDCREDFMRAFAQAVKLGDWNEIELVRPFEHLTKGEIVRTGLQLGVPFDLTWSCYKGGEKHCGKCGTCVERAEAFDSEGAEDPVEYLDGDYFRTVTAKSGS